MFVVPEFLLPTLQETVANNVIAQTVNDTHLDLILGTFQDKCSIALACRWGYLDSHFMLIQNHT